MSHTSKITQQNLFFKHRTKINIHDYIIQSSSNCNDAVIITTTKTDSQVVKIRALKSLQIVFIQFVASANYKNLPKFSWHLNYFVTGRYVISAI